MAAQTSKRSRPNYWKLDCGGDDTPPTEYPELEGPSRIFFQELIKRCSHSPGGGCDCSLSYLRESEALHIWRIENKTQWEVYRAKKRKLVRRLQEAKTGARVSCQVLDINPPLRTAGVKDFLGREKWDADSGEVFLFHGAATESAAFEIADKGFNAHLATPGANFGAGCYFTDEFCKAAFYANRAVLKKGSGTAVVLLCRVSLGHHFQVPNGQAVKPDARRPPRKCTCANETCTCGEYYDSVVAALNTRTGNLVQGTHREIVVYDPDLAYPEFMFMLRPLSAPEPSQQPVRTPSFEDSVKAVIAVMKTNTNSADIQEIGCATLRKLADTSNFAPGGILGWFFIGFQRQQRIDIIAMEGGIETIFEAMSKHWGSEGMVQQACVALSCFAGSGSKRTREKIGAEGGIVTVVAGAMRHGESAMVQIGACAVFVYLAQHTKVAASIVTMGGIRTVVFGMSKHRELENVQSWGALALQRLAVNQAYSVKIGAEGGIKAVIAAMIKHDNSVRVQESGYGLLANLSVIPENAVKIGAEGGITAVIAGMRTHGAVVGIQEHGCKTLLNLASNCENCAKIRTEGGVGVMTCAIKKHWWSWEVQVNGRALLRKLRAQNHAHNSSTSVVLFLAGGAGAIVLLSSSFRIMMPPPRRIIW